MTQQAVSDAVGIANSIVEVVNSKSYQTKTIVTSFMGSRRSNGSKQYP